jgi:hypothetical protein
LKNSFFSVGQATSCGGCAVGDSLTATFNRIAVKPGKLIMSKEKNLRVNTLKINLYL